MDIQSDKILIIDFGSQYTQLIARRVRELGVYCEIYGYEIANEAIERFAPSGIILSGGPQSVTGDHSARAPDIVFHLGCPVLGICYGQQTMAVQLGGQVNASHQREYGHALLTVNLASALFARIKPEDKKEDNIPIENEVATRREVVSNRSVQIVHEDCEQPKQRSSGFISDGYSALNVWMSHGDKVDVLPPGFHVIAHTPSAPLAGMADPVRHFYGIQFHPEVTHTEQGKAILEQFVHSICGCSNLWNSNNIIAEKINEIREQVGDDEVILGLSGGVDSSVVAALLHKAIAEKLTCVFVDTGLLRLNEADRVMDIMNHMGVKVIVVAAQQRFLNALMGESDPEKKRKIIGQQFIEVFEEESAKLSQARWLAQGTIYSDVIESATHSLGKAQVIKSHHNVGGLPERMRLKLIEPLRELFKDEVRQLGVELGLPYEMVYCHPFPGPGLGVRILGEVKAEYADILRKADAIFIEELRKHDLYYKVSQAFTVFLPVKSVAVMGDARVYDYVIALRAVESIDFMTAHWAHLPYDFLGLVSNRIINEVRGISRVVYDISGKPPATIEWE